MTSPTARSLAYARKMGMVAGVVERWNPHSKTRHDLFGFIDFVIMAPVKDPAMNLTVNRIIAVQATTDNNRWARRTKIQAEPRAKMWCDCDGLIELWTWGRKGPNGKRKLWTLTRERIEL